MAKPKIINPLKQNRATCSKHPNLSLDQICISPLCLDNCLLCTKCVQKYHNNEEHQIQALCDFMEKNVYKLSLNAKATNMKGYLKKLQSCSERIIENVDYFQVQMAKLAESMRKKVKLHFGAIIQSFDEKSSIKMRQQLERSISLQKVKELCEKVEIIERDQFEMNEENLEKIQNSYMRLLSSAHSKVAELMKRFQNISFDYSIEIQNAKCKKEFPELTQSNQQIKQNEDDDCQSSIVEEILQQNLIKDDQNQNGNQQQSKYGLRDRKLKRYNLDSKEGRKVLNQDSKQKQMKDSRSRDKNHKKQTQIPRQEEVNQNLSFQQDEKRTNKKRELRRKQDESSILKFEGINDMGQSLQNKEPQPAQEQQPDASTRAKKRQKGKSLKFLDNSQQIKQQQKNQKNQSEQKRSKQVLELAPFTIQLLPMKPQKLQSQKKSSKAQQLRQIIQSLEIKNKSMGQNIEFPTQSNCEKGTTSPSTFITHKGIKRPTVDPTSLTEQQLKDWFFENFKTPDRPYSLIITHRLLEDSNGKAFEYLLYSNDEFNWYNEQFLDVVDERGNIDMYHESLGVYMRD